MENIEYTCKFCSRICKNGNSLRNHERLCKENPNRQQGIGGSRVDSEKWQAYIKSKKGTICGQYRIEGTCRFCNRTFTTTKSGLSQHENCCNANPNKVIRVGTPHTEEWKKDASNRAKKNNLGGWHTSRSFDYKGIKLDSSYEVTFAEDLDKNGIKWERPKPLLYKLNGEEHRYYPDFFIPDYNIYVDTKNDYLINHVNPKYGITDIEKISLVMQQNNVKIFILDKNNLLWSNLPL